MEEREKVSRYTNCSKCPCRNNDYESGSDCNLEYTMSLEWYEKASKKIVPDTQEMRKSQKDFELAYVSFDCELERIVTKGGEFFPDVVFPGRYEEPQVGA